jgi:transcription antitermination factor NusG
MRRTREASWVILELSPKGEEEALKGKLKSRITSCYIFEESDIYIPLLRQTYSEPIWLMEGYIFIKCGYPSNDYYQLKRDNLVKNIISEIDERSGMISIGVVSDSDFKKMINQVDKLGGSFKTQDQVRIKAGCFRGFEGEIMDTWLCDGLRMYSVHLTFRSVDILLTVDGISVEGV